ncbi:nicotinate phosphoribosyltransferase isoform X2 [Chiloscyllium punctatum]|uniref:nicotinate phosphoribosyltransferase isoform X2 n=1 Tax=Chiloscyllium punctatum TaxID=137246 RepID=UPI003B63C79D
MCCFLLNSGSVSSVQSVCIGLCPYESAGSARGAPNLLTLSPHAARTMLREYTAQPLLTDFYQFTMAYGYWKCGREQSNAVFELYFRENPRESEFTIFAGLQDCLLFVSNYKLKEEDIDFLQTVLPPTTDPAFYDYLRNIDTSTVTLRAVPEGSVVFPKVALLEVEGPLAILQLLETPLLTLVNYASLVATNAARFRLAAGPGKQLLELGLRRAQGPDGGLSASRYSYIGGFDGTSNVIAGKLYTIPLFGSMAHSYITSFTSMSEVKVQTLRPASGGPEVNFVSLCEKWLFQVCIHLQMPQNRTNSSEFAAFISYATTYPRHFIALVDSYSVMSSGVPNFCAVSLALDELGYRARGVRLDSGDQLEQSLRIRSSLQACADQFAVSWLAAVPIIISNSISLNQLINLQHQDNEVDCIGVGTNLVTCPLQPSLGCVYKLSQVDGEPRIKMTEEEGKMTLPGKKAVYRLYGTDGSPFLDLLTLAEEPELRADEEIKCYALTGRCAGFWVTAVRVETLHRVYYQHGQICESLCTTSEIRRHAQSSLNNLAPKYKHLHDPAPYQVAISQKLRDLLDDLIKKSSPSA